MAEQEYRSRRRARALDHLGGRCVACGTTDRLEFDHIDPATKVLTISTAIAKHWSWERMLVELAKCQLLCHDHHVEKSRAEARSKVTHGKYHAAYHLRCGCAACAEFRATYVPPRRAPTNRQLPPGEFKHGTRAGYLKERREGLDPCAECRAANSAAAKSRRKAQRSG